MSGRPVTLVTGSIPPGCCSAVSGFCSACCLRHTQGAFHAFIVCRVVMPRPTINSLSSLPSCEIESALSNSVVTNPTSSSPASSLTMHGSTSSPLTVIECSSSSPHPPVVSMVSSSSTSAIAVVSLGNRDFKIERRGRQKLTGSCVYAIAHAPV